MARIVATLNSFCMVSFLNLSTVIVISFLFFSFLSEVRGSVYRSGGGGGRVGGGGGGGGGGCKYVLFLWTEVEVEDLVEVEVEVKMEVEGVNMFSSCY